MKRVLFVDDDPVLLRIYKPGLVRHGLQVETANDGVAAINALHSSPPDLVVLDLMMPKLSGTDVLKYMRSDPQLKALPVIVLSNAFMNALGGEDAVVGAQRAMLKTRCSPELLFAAIEEVLAGKTPVGDSPVPAPAAKPGVAPPVNPPSPLPPFRPREPARPVPVPQSNLTRDHEWRARAREELLANAGATCATLRSLLQTLANAAPGENRRVPLQDLYRKVHFLSAAAGLSEFHRLAYMASVLEALLFQMMDQPARITNSALRTTFMTIDFFEVLFGERPTPGGDSQPAGRVLVVDDDPASSRMSVWALSLAKLRVRSAGNVKEALEWLGKEWFALVVLDSALPGMGGFEFCRRVRQLPGYQDIPVIHFANDSDFDTRVKSFLSGSDDMIAKPLLPMELAVKAVMHLLRSRAGEAQ